MMRRAASGELIIHTLELLHSLLVFLHTFTRLATAASFCIAKNGRRSIPNHLLVANEAHLANVSFNMIPE